MNKIKHVFFDLDNTLWDFRKNAKLALAELYKKYDVEAKYGYTFEEFHPYYHESNESLWALIRDKRITKEELRERRFREAFEHLGIHNTELAAIFEHEYIETITNYNELVEGALDLLDYLKPKYALHIITNGFIEVSKRKIETSDLKGYFETVTYADELKILKPDPRIFDYALHKANAQKKESIYIGDDWIADAVGAKAYGMEAIFVDRLDDNFVMDGVPTIKHLKEVKNYL
ncbi:YjjG family noncanonical pyrimidine nucleotidase [Vaginella massiliensis]|uniref:YjjG family noncanonical pyrimidine nucleotidase n=1 Tax=Vaginella massiliensis TaxID=1816680 RepID=UPI000837F8D4|nr:YjjG family noncanonical pyrimidine nucleotidase [Vaginella massiliensis]